VSCSAVCQQSGRLTRSFHHMATLEYSRGS
jgi:hypothetical protein